MVRRWSGYVSVDVSLDDVISEISNEQLIEEARERGLDASGCGGRMEDLERALLHKDWEEVAYLVRTYVLPSQKAPLGPKTPLFQKAAH